MAFIFRPYYYCKLWSLVILLILTFSLSYSQSKIIIKTDFATNHLNKALRSQILIRQLDLLDLSIIEFKNQAQSDKFLQSIPSNVYQIDQLLELRFDPSDPIDPLIHQQWYLNQIQADRLWPMLYGTGRNTSTREIVIGVIDNGFNIRHEDLIESLWSNKFELLDGIDNDQNGYVDDIYGLSLYSTHTHPIDTSPIKSHGTLVAGIAGATSDNNKGITSLTPGVKLALGSFDLSSLAELLELYNYLGTLKQKYLKSNGREGANIVVINWSGGVPFGKAKDFPLLCGLYDRLGELGILSVGVTINDNVNVDEDGDIPTTCESDYLITCTYTDQDDHKASNSGYGKKSIDLGVPGDGLISTSANGNNLYQSFSGNSAAGPLLAGSISLMYYLSGAILDSLIFINPSEIALMIKESILYGVDHNASLEKYTLSGGRLNVFNSYQYLSNRLKNLNSKQNSFRVFQSNNNRLVLDKLNFHSQIIDIDITIINILGQLVSHYTHQTPLNGKIFIENVQWTAGTYFIVAKSGTDQQVNKFIWHH